MFEYLISIYGFDFNDHSYGRGTGNQRFVERVLGEFLPASERVRLHSKMDRGEDYILHYEARGGFSCVTCFEKK